MELGAGDIEELTILSIKAMMGAAQHGKSLVEIELDPMKRYQLPGVTGAGKLLIVVAGGESIGKLKAAINKNF